MSRAPLVIAVGPPELAEIASMALLDAGATAIVEHRRGAAVELHAGFRDPRGARTAIGHLPSGIEAEVIEVEADDWVLTQRGAIAPVRAGRFEIRPPWSDGPDEPEWPATGIVIDPGVAFGHGGHPSTILLLQMLDTIVESGSRVVDVGSGTGILSIAAAHLGARVLAVDVDARAVEVTRANLRRNGLDGLVDVELVSTVDRSSFDADVALVNLTLDVQRAVADRLDRVPVVAMSGILDEQADAAARLHHRRAVLRTASHDGWTALLLGR